MTKIWASKWKKNLSNEFLTATIFPTWPQPSLAVTSNIQFAHKYIWFWFHLWNLLSLICWPPGGNTASYKHNINILSPYKVVMVNVQTNSPPSQSVRALELFSDLTRLSAGRHHLSVTSNCYKSLLKMKINQFYDVTTLVKAWLSLDTKATWSGLGRIMIGNRRWTCRNLLFCWPIHPPRPPPPVSI